MAYIGKGLDNGVRNRFIFAATQGQKVFTGSDLDGKTLTISDALYCDVYHNGVKIKLTTDWSSSTTTMTLVTGASVNDVIEIISFDVFGVPNTVPSFGGTFTGAISATSYGAVSGTTGTFSGTLGVAGVLTTTAPTVFNGGFASPNQSSVIIPDGGADDNWAFQISNLEATDGRSYGLKIKAGSTTDEALVIQDHDGSNTLFSVLGNGRGLSQFTAKAWVNFNGTGTVAIRDSHNVSSITDNGTGDYTVNFSNNLANANYSVSFNSGMKSVVWGLPLFAGLSGFGNTDSHSTSKFRVTSVSPGDTVHDNSMCNAIIFGD